MLDAALRRLIDPALKPVAAAINATPNGAIQLNFARAREVLSLLIGTDNGVVVVRFTITPR